MTDYRARDAWTDTEPGGVALVPAEVRAVAVHWPGSKAAFGSRPASVVARYLQGVRRYHVEDNGWDDIAYQVAFDQDGRVWDLRGIDRRSAANGATGPNQANGAVLFLVGPGEEPSAALLAAFRDWRSRHWLRAYPLARAVVGHQDVRPDPTDCPGDVVEALIRTRALTTAPAEPEDDEMDAFRYIKGPVTPDIYVLDLTTGQRRHVSAEAWEALRLTGGRPPVHGLPQELFDAIPKAEGSR